ncbi:hypothetical protein KDN24_12885 [Bacillus sp. Bva_UNVM-123]|uniref:hypothetical protein n=1 Tax=Bacillus sp. Bva_UNVM-123 TaxID=2829798 RepID=UPI00391F2A10
MANKKKSTDEAFSKQQILSSENYRNQRDLLNALLKEDKDYSLKEVSQLVADFMKRKVK